MQLRVKGCSIDEDTDFRDMGIENTRIQSGKKILLKYNTRRMNWKDWYKGKSKNKWKIKFCQFKTLSVRLFWAISDYGRSTRRIIWSFII